MRRRGWGWPGERGETLIEALVTTAVLAIAVVGILGAFAAGETTTRLKASQGALTTAVVASAEALKAAPFTACASAATYAPGNPQVIVTAVQYWDPTLQTSGAPVGWSGTCTTGVSDKLQLLQIQAQKAVGLRSPDIETLSLVKAPWDAS